MMLKTMAAAWEQQSKMEGHSEQARKMQNANIKALYEPLKAKLLEIANEAKAATDTYKTVLASQRESYRTKSTAIAQKMEEKRSEIGAVLQEQRALPPEPTRNNAMNLVNATLKNKNSSTKLRLLGNLAGKSTLFSKKQNRIAAGRNALIAKQANLSRKNYNAMVLPKKIALQKKYEALVAEESQLQKEYTQEGRTAEVEQKRTETVFLNTMKGLLKDYRSVLQKSESYYAQHGNTINSSFNTSLTDLVLDIGDLSETLGTVLESYKPAPPPPRTIYRAYNLTRSPKQYAPGTRWRLNSGDPNYDPSNRRWMY